MLPAAVPVNLYVDHLTNSTLVSSEDLYAQLQSQPKLFADAARAIGLTPREFAEFRNDLLDGQADYITLPHHIDAMSGAHRGHAYAVRNALVPDGVKGWVVMLSDGAKVYVPRICGNLSLVREPIVASHLSIPAKKVAAATLPAPLPVTPVILTPPEPADVALMPQATVLGPAPRTPQVPGGLYALPFLGFLFDHASSGSPHNDIIPLCTAGSNSTGICKM
jgi:hypothetical protein